MKRIALVSVSPAPRAGFACSALRAQRPERSARVVVDGTFRVRESRALMALTLESIRSRVETDCPTHGPIAAAACEMCVRLVLVATVDSELPLGTCKVGGSPDLPAGFVWPVCQSEVGATPLLFIGQINLSEVAATRAGLALPTNGLLSFFVDFWSAVLQKDSQAWTVQHFSDLDELVRTSPPSTGVPERDPVHSIGCAAVKLVAAPSLPDPFDSIFLRPPGLSSNQRIQGITNDEFDAYTAIQGDIDTAVGTTARHQLLGHDSGVQNPMIDEVRGAIEDSTEALATTLAAEQPAWQLLLHLDSDPQAQLDWGIQGQAYFAIPGPDLEAVRFDRVWFNAQW